MTVEGFPDIPEGHDLSTKDVAMLAIGLNVGLAEVVAQLLLALMAEVGDRKEPALKDLQDGIRLIKRHSATVERLREQIMKNEAAGG